MPAVVEIAIEAFLLLIIYVSDQGGHNLILKIF